MADLFLNTDATLPSGTSIDVVVYEDTDRDGVAENTATQSIGSGINSYTLTGFDVSSGNDYWVDIDFSTSNVNNTGTVNYVELSNQSGTILSEGFEDGNDNGWRTPSNFAAMDTINVTTNQANSGSYSYELGYSNVTSSNKVRAIELSSSDFSEFSFYVYVTTTSGDDVPIGPHEYQTLSDGSNRSRFAAFNLRDEVNNDIEVITGPGKDTSGHTMSTNEWYYFRMYNISFGNSADYEVQDSTGTTVFSGNISVGSQSPNSHDVQYAQGASANSGTLYIDDITYK